MLSYLLSTLDSGRLGATVMLHGSVFNWGVKEDAVQVSLFDTTLQISISELPVAVYIDIPTLAVKKVSLDEFDYVGRVIKRVDSYEIIMVIYRDPWCDVPVILEHPKLKSNSEHENRNRLLPTNTVYNSFEEIKKINAPMLKLSGAEGEFTFNDFAILKSGKYNISLSYAKPFDIWSKVAMTSEGQVLMFCPKKPEFSRLYISGALMKGLNKVSSIEFKQGTYDIVCTIEKDNNNSYVKLYEGNYDLSVCQYKVLFI